VILTIGNWPVNAASCASEDVNALHSVIKRQ
jgi:hypothetical protein